MKVFPISLDPEGSHAYKPAHVSQIMNLAGC